MLRETLLVLRQAGQEFGGPLCLALRDVSLSSPWHKHAPVLGNRTGRCGCARGLCLSGDTSPACRSAFRAAAVLSAASKSASGRRRWQVLLLLPCEPLPPDLLPTGPPKSLCPGIILVGQHRGGEELKLAEYGSKPTFFLRAPSFLFACYVNFQSKRCPSLLLSSSHVDDAL